MVAQEAGTGCPLERCEFMKTSMQTSFACPATEAVIEFDLPSDEQACRELWPHSLQIQCPACGEIHETPFRDAYVTAVMRQFPCVPQDLKAAPLQ